MKTISPEYFFVSATIGLVLGLLINAVLAFSERRRREEDQKRYELETDLHYLQHLKYFPEFLDEWEESFDRKILVGPLSPPQSINNQEPSVVFHDEWEEAEQMASGAELVGDGFDAWRYWESKGGWDEEGVAE